jgi:hypothetical protein
VSSGHFSQSDMAREERMAFQLLDDGHHAVMSADSQVVSLHACGARPCKLVMRVRFSSPAPQGPFELQAAPLQAAAEWPTEEQ